MLVCDIDGVLLELSVAEVAAYVAAISESLGGVEVDTDWNAYAARNDIEIIREIFGRHRGRAPTREEEAAVVDLYHEKLRECLAGSDELPVWIGNVVDAVAWAAETLGIGVAVATANTRCAARMRLAAARLPIALDIGGAAEDGRTKVEILAQALRQAHGQSTEPRDSILYVGDNLVDLEAARHAGVTFLGIAKNSARELEMRSAGAKHVMLRNAPTDDICAMLLELMAIAP